VDETVGADLKFHQQTVASDANSPLHLIREKELEISGRMLAAKRKADEVVADARKQAASAVAAAQDDAKELAVARDQAVTGELEALVAQIRVDTDRDIETLNQTIAERRDGAVSHVVNAILGS
jgi:vacuolar-type H+-ATPase subunit H